MTAALEQHRDRDSITLLLAPSICNALAVGKQDFDTLRRCSEAVGLRVLCRPVQELRRGPQAKRDQKEKRHEAIRKLLERRCAAEPAHRPAESG